MCGSHTCPITQSSLSDKFQFHMGGDNFFWVQMTTLLLPRCTSKRSGLSSLFNLLSRPPATIPSLPPLHLKPSLDMGSNKHTIILMQTSPNRATRTFMDYESITQAMDGICGLYERKLKELNPTNRNLTYDIADLYNFVDGLADLSALVYDHSIQAYLPYDRQWIKQRIFQHLKKLAAPSTR